MQEKSDKNELYWDYDSNENWLEQRIVLEKSNLHQVENLVKLRELMVKTVDRIVDPNNSDPIIRELFLIKHLFSKIPDDRASLKFLQHGLMLLK